MGDDREAAPIATMTEVEIRVGAGRFEAGFERTEVEALGADEHQPHFPCLGRLPQGGREDLGVVLVRQLDLRSRKPVVPLGMSAIGSIKRSGTAQNPRANLASSVIISGLQEGSKTIFGWTAETPGRSPTNSFICSETWGPIGQAGVVRVKVT